MDESFASGGGVTDCGEATLPHTFHSVQIPLGTRQNVGGDYTLQRIGNQKVSKGGVHAKSVRNVDIIKCTSERLTIRLSMYLLIVVYSTFFVHDWSPKFH